MWLYYTKWKSDSKHFNSDKMNVAYKDVNSLFVFIEELQPTSKPYAQSANEENQFILIFSPMKYVMFSLCGHIICNQFNVFIFARRQLS